MRAWLPCLGIWCFEGSPRARTEVRPESQGGWCSPGPAAASCVPEESANDPPPGPLDGKAGGGGALPQAAARRAHMCMGDVWAHTECCCTRGNVMVGGVHRIIIIIIP